jgi:predicted DNA-binding transcriptional regulator YafY
MQTELLSEIFLTEAFEPNHQSLVDLVTNKRIISFYYKGSKEVAAGWRTVEPVCYGERRGIRYLRAWQQAGKTATIVPSWKFFRVDRIKNWNLSSNKVNDKARDKFNPKGDKLLDKIYAISDYTPKNVSTIIPATKPTGKSKSTALVKRLKTLEEIFLID